MRKILNKAVHYFSYFIIILALIVSLFRALSPVADFYESNINAFLSQSLGLDIKIGSVSTSWYWIYPVLELHQVEVYPHTQKSISIQKILIGLNLKVTLSQHQITPGLIVLENFSLSLNGDDTGWHLRGDNAVSTAWDDKTKRALFAFLQQGKVFIKDANIDMLYQQVNYNFTHLSASLVTKQQNLSFAMNAAWGDDNHSRLKLLSHLTFQKVHDHYLFSGKIYGKFDDLKEHYPEGLPLWGAVIQDVQGDSEVWSEIKQNQWQSAQARLHLDHLKLSVQEHPLQLNQLSGNLGWQVLDEGYRLIGNQLKFESHGQEVPPFNVLLNYGAAERLNSLDISHLPLSPILPMLSPWFESLHVLQQYHPVGELQEIQLLFDDHQCEQLSLLFSELGWVPKGKIIGLSGLNGHLHMQGEGGDFEIKGRPVTLLQTGIKPLQWTTLFSSGQWKKEAYGLRLIIDTFKAQNPIAHLHFSGMLDGVDGSNKVANLNLQGEFQLKNFKKTIPFWPKSLRNIGVYDWFHEDVSQLEGVDGNFVFHGSLNKPSGKMKIQAKHLALKNPFLIDSKTIRGDLTFLRGRFTVANFTGLMMGQSAKATLMRIEEKNPYLSLKLSSKAYAQQLKALFPSPIWDYITGLVPYQLLVSITDNAFDLDNIHFSSDLQGVEVRLPPPLGKKAVVKQGVILDIGYQQGKRLRFHIGWSRLGEADLSFGYQKGGWQFNGAEIIFGGGQHAFANANQVINVKGELSSLDLQQWSNFFNTFGHSNPKKLNFRIATDLFIQHLIYAKKDFGCLKIIANLKAGLLRLNQLSLNTQDYAFLMNAQQNTTKIQNLALTLNIHHVKNFLKQFNLPQNFEAETIAFDGSLTVPEQYQFNDWTSLKGKLNFKITHGRWLDPSTPVGQWRVTNLLNLLSVKKIHRRLMLDFKDVLEKGYPFRVAKGEVVLEKGILKTERSEIESEVFLALIKGSVDLNSGLLDLLVRIKPNLSSGVPAIATIFGGPVVGAATLIASQTTMYSVNNLIRSPFELYRFKIEGPWRSYKIQAV